jgi:hypothetical protein
VGEPELVFALRDSLFRSFGEMAASALTMLLPWPLATGAKLLLAPARAAGSPAPDFREEPVLASPVGQLSVVLGGATKAAFAAAVYALAPPDLAAAAALAPAWAARIAARDLAITWLIGGTWDWLHLSPRSPLFETLRPYRFAEPDAPYPTVARLEHDFLWASCGALVSTCWEVRLTHPSLARTHAKAAHPELALTRPPPTRRFCFCTCGPPARCRSQACQATRGGATR